MQIQMIEGLASMENFSTDVKEIPDVLLVRLCYYAKLNTAVGPFVSENQFILVSLNALILYSS